MKATINHTLEILACGKCGVMFGMPASMHANRLESGEDFYCPNGHEIHFAAGRRRAEREAEPDYERQQERLLALHTQEQLEAKVADAESKAAEAEQRAKAAETAARAARRGPAELPAASPAAPAKSHPPAVADRVQCPKCDHRPYKNLTCLRAHLEYAHDVPTNDAVNLINGLLKRQPA